jgi:outer membrane protein assembly factor BamB
MNIRSTKTMMIAAVVVFSLSEVAAQSADWPQWRGPNRDGISKDTGLLKQWPENGPPLVWKTTGAGNGYSSLAIAGSRLFTMGVRGGREYVLAFDVATGKEIWATPNGSVFNNDKGDGPRGTPTIDGNRLFALGGNGDLSCIETEAGRVVWTLNILQKFGGSNPRWGISESPLVIGEKVLVNAGGPNASLVALNKKDGSVIWKTQSDPAGYSSAMPVQIGGTTQIVFFTDRRAVGVDLKDGQFLWSYPRASNKTANVATPVVRGNRVFLSSDYGTGAGLIEIKDDGSAQEVYFTREMRNHHSSSILIGDYLYGFSSGILTAMRFDTGAVAWRDRSVGKGSLAYADGQLYALSENGVVGLIDATPTGYVERGRFRIPQDSLPTWTHPVVAGGRLYLRDQNTIYAFDVRAKN